MSRLEFLRPDGWTHGLLCQPMTDRGWLTGDARQANRSAQVSRCYIDVHEVRTFVVTTDHGDDFFAPGTDVLPRLSTSR